MKFALAKFSKWIRKCSNDRLSRVRQIQLPDRGDRDFELENDPIQISELGTLDDDPVRM